MKSFTRAVSKLMSRYADTPMDFADATLVLLGEALEVFDIVTLHRRGFSTYRPRRSKHFSLYRICGSGFQPDSSRMSG